MEIIIIAAMAKNRVIGRDNKMPWHVPEELQLFKKTTMGYPMVMGRKTFDSFPAPLPGRRHIVLSRNEEYYPKGGEPARSLDEALEKCDNIEKVFIIGGAQIFTQSLDVVTTIVLTLFEFDAKGDVTFPEFSNKLFVEEERVHHPDGSEPFTVVTYRQKIE